MLSEVDFESNEGEKEGVFFARNIQTSRDSRALVIVAAAAAAAVTRARERDRGGKRWRPSQSIHMTDLTGSR